MNEWIKCIDELPPDCTDILLYSQEEGILKGAYHKTCNDDSIFYTQCFHSHREFKPTHWMLIPEPPKEDDV